MGACPVNGAEPRLAAVHGVNVERRQSTSAQRKNWGPACEPGAYQRVDLNGEGRVTVDKRCVPAVEALSKVLRAHGYATRRADTGAYNCRQITGGTGFSLHAYGIAIDINWSTNPYGKRLVTDMLGADGQDRSMVDAILAIRTNNGARVWEWGGDWSGNKDAMHFEIDCTPADLATGLQGHDPEEGFTMDAAAQAEFDKINARLDKIEGVIVDPKGRLAGIRTDLTSLVREVVTPRSDGGRGPGWLRRTLADFDERLPKG
jgi:hypothetical protein